VEEDTQECVESVSLSELQDVHDEEVKSEDTCDNPTDAMDLIEILAFVRFFNFQGSSQGHGM
jgi:hypothetical protein